MFSRDASFIAGSLYNRKLLQKEKLQQRMRQTNLDEAVGSGCGSVKQQQRRKAKRHLIDLHRQNIRALSLIVCTFTYLMIGAAIFDQLESVADGERYELFQNLKDKMQAKYNFSAKDYSVIEHVVIKSIPHKAGWQWRFSGSFYFATVVITTVGYGHSTPATIQGKIFCIFYALAGIPLNLVMFQSIGERLNTLICYCLTKIRKGFKMHNREVTMTHMLMVSSTLGSLVVVVGTYLFSEYEGWNYFESFYYCFITLTTIGFGDYVALQSNEALQKKPEYVVFSLLFILFGMAIFAAAVNLFVLRFMATASDSDQDKEDSRIKAVVLRGLTQSDEELSQIRGGGFRPRKLTNEHNSTLILKKISVAGRPLSNSNYYKTIVRRAVPPLTAVEPSVAHCSCWRGFERAPCQLFESKPHYTVRRAPIRRISHLLQHSSPANIATSSRANVRDVYLPSATVAPKPITPSPQELVSPGHNEEECLIQKRRRPSL